MSDTANYSGTFGGGLSFGNGASTTAGPGDGADVTPTSAPQPSFGEGIRSIMPGPSYRAPDPATSALDQTADMLDQRIQRANTVATNPVLQFFNPEGVAAARDFVPKATEALQKIKQQKAGMAAGRTQAETLGLSPGEVPDEATMADRVEAARSKALRGDLRVFKGLQAVDPKTAEAIQDQVHEVVAGHLNKAQFAFDSLAGMQNQGQYQAKLNELRRTGALSDLDALGLKVPETFDAFNTVKAREGQALREARIGINTIKQKLEERNTYQPMEEKEAKTYNGRMTTVYGDQVTNGTWARNGAAGTRGLIINGAADPRDLGTKFTLATPEQRKAIKEEFDGAVPKAAFEKTREFNRTYQLATTDAKGNPVAEGKINTNPNVQQGISEGLASMLRGPTGSANVGLIKIELGKRGWAQAAIDGLVTNYAGAMNTLFKNADKPYLSEQTQRQIRDVMDVLKTYNDKNIGDRGAQIAKRAGALGLDSATLGLGRDESAGVVSDAIKAGRDEQVARMLPNHQAIGGGDGVFQLNAQRPGMDAVQPPRGAAASATQLPGAQPLQTPVQQATQSPGSPPAIATVPPPSAPQGIGPGGPAGGGAPPSVSGPAAPQPGPAGGAPAPAAPVTIAGQQINAPALPPGASPDYLAKTQRIESGREKDPWRAGTKATSASGAFQFISSTWAADKPPDAPARAGDATPQQQADAAATRAAKNASALTKAGLPVNDTNLYIAHNLGEGAGPKLLTADPGADARTIVGETAAKNNPLFFRGKPTVATVLARYDAEMNPEPTKPRPGSAGAEAPGGLMSRVRSYLNAGAAPEGSPNPSDASLPPEQRREATMAAASAAPAAMSTAGALAGSVAGPGGTIAGGAVGGGAGQSLKDYLQGRAQSPSAIAKEAALGGVLGIMPAGRPIAGTAARVAGVGGVEAGAAAAKGGSAEDVTEAGLKGAALAAGGEAFGRALGMVGHKVFSMFAPEAQKTVREAAAKFATAEETLAKETPTLPSVGGAAGGKNPKYEAAEKARTEAETVLKDAGLKPEEAAYAHKVSSEGVPRREAEVSRPGALEEERVGSGYEQLRSEVGATGVGAVKPAAKLPDGPRAAVENKRVSAAHAELADHVEMAITAPAPDWRTKWTQLQKARSDLLTAERDALSSTAPGRTKTAADMRTMADTVRVQQEKAAKYVFGEKDGEAFMARLKTLDTRYRNLMEATNGGDLAKAAAMKGETGRDADRKFRAFAHDDPAALAAWAAMRRTGANLEQGVHDLVAAERIPVLGKVFSAAKLLGSFNRWMRERAAGSPAKFEDILNAPADGTARAIRDVTGTAAQRGAVM